MRIVIICVLFLITSQVYSQIKNVETQITETLRALPDSQKENATVIGYNRDGKRAILKKGSNDIICWADNPSQNDPRGAFFVVCFPKSLEAYMNRTLELTTSGMANAKALEIVASEIKTGKIIMPKLAVRYTLRGHSPEGALPLTVIHVPFSTSESTGFSEEIDNFRPWLMWAGTAHAHIMVPGH